MRTAEFSFRTRAGVNLINTSMISHSLTNCLKRGNVPRICFKTKQVIPLDEMVLFYLCCGELGTRAEFGAALHIAVTI